MIRRRRPVSGFARTNRRGCFALATILALAMAGLAYIGIKGDPIDDEAKVIPTLGTVSLLLVKEPGAVTEGTVGRSRR